MIALHRIAVVGFFKDSFLGFALYVSAIEKGQRLWWWFMLVLVAIATFALFKNYKKIMTIRRLVHGSYHHIPVGPIFDGTQPRNLSIAACALRTGNVSDWATL